MIRMPATTWTGHWKCLDETTDRQNVTNRHGGRGLELIIGRQCSGIGSPAGWKRLTLDGQNALLLYAGELGTSAFTDDRPRSTVMD